MIISTITDHFTRYKKIVGVIIVFITLGFATPAAAQTLNQLRTQLKDSVLQDTSKVQLMARLAHSYSDVSSDSMIAIAKQGMVLGEKINFPRGTAACMKQLAIGFSNRNQYDSAITYYNAALYLYEHINHLDGQAVTLQAMANISSRQMKYGLSMEYYEKSMAISRKLHDMGSVAHSLINIGINYIDLGDYPEAIKNYLEALKIYEAEKNKAGTILSLTNLASAYSQVGDPKKAMQYVNRALAIQDGKGDKHGLISFYSDIASVYASINEYKKGLAYFDTVYSLANAISDDYWSNIALVNMAETYLNSGNIDSAFVKYTQTLKHLEVSDDVYVGAVARAGIGKILLLRGKTKEGISYLVQSYNIARQIGVKEVVSASAESLSDAYAGIKEYDKALLYRKVFELYKDSIHNEKNDRRIQQLQFDYQLEKNKAVAKSKSEKQTTVILAMIAALASVCIISVLLFRSRQHEKRNKEKSMVLANEIQIQATQLEELNCFKDKTFSVLSHDLRVPLGAFTYAVSMLDRKVISQEDFNELKPEINRQLNSLNLLLENLLNWSRSHIQGIDTTHPKTINIGKIALDNIAVMQHAADNKTISIHNDITQNISAYADAAHVDIVIRNLINNALKFTPEGGSITLSAQKEGSNVKVAIADTGVGMNEEQLEKLFKVVTNNSTYGTDGEKGTGLGLLLCYEFIRANNGSISVVSREGYGTTFTLLLPGPHHTS